MAKAKTTKKKAPAKKKTTAKRGKKAVNSEILVVTSKVKAAIRESADCNVAGDAVEGLNNYVHWLITQATARAKANKRKTVRKDDFLVM